MAGSEGDGEDDGVGEGEGEGEDDGVGEGEQPVDASTRTAARTSHGERPLALRLLALMIFQAIPFGFPLGPTSVWNWRAVNSHARS